MAARHCAGESQAASASLHGHKQWRLDLGAEVYPDGVRFRVWAPQRHRVDVVLVGEPEGVVALNRESTGYFTGFIPQLTAGVLYRYRLDGEQCYPDPCSRFQPEGPHGPSQIVDPQAYGWHDTDWPGVALTGQVIYELHIGTFTPAGTFDAAAQHLETLKELGITLLEVMPVAAFPGRWNWGYDGVDLYAPSQHYGDAEAFKRFVDQAHALGMGVILDVVYNHFGPDGNYLRAYSDDYFTDRYDCEWGDAINFDGPNAREVREFFARNACYWIAEFHLDGLRLDATQQIFDASPVHILAEVSQRARAVAWPRSIVLIAENEPQDVRCLLPVEEGGFGLDGMWNDDFHHAARVAFTGRREAYYTDYRGAPQEFISTVKRGFLYQGQRYHWQKKPRGSVVKSSHSARAFVLFTQNHDQVANTLHGERILALTSPARYRALTALMLLAPGTPMFFMGQEFGASNPFLFFADHCKQVLAASVYQGRKEFLAQFPSYGSTEAQAAVPDPCAPLSFARSKLQWAEREAHVALWSFHQDLLRLRREDPVIAAQDHTRIDGAVLDASAFVLRFFSDDGDDRLLLVNLGSDLVYIPAPEPLLAPVHGGAWRLVWSSDHPHYGGPGIIHPNGDTGWRISGESTTFFTAVLHSK